MGDEAHSPGGLRSLPLEKDLEKKAPFKDLQGHSSGIRRSFEKVINSPGDWKKLWSKHVRKQTPKPPLPEVDFKKNEIIAIFAGNKPTGGYTVQIKKIEDTSWEGMPARLVYFKLTEPLPDQMRIMTATQPFLFRVVSRLEGRTFFKKIP